MEFAYQNIAVTWMPVNNQEISTSYLLLGSVPLSKTSRNLTSSIWMLSVYPSRRREIIYTQTN